MGSVLQCVSAWSSTPSSDPPIRPLDRQDTTETDAPPSLSPFLKPLDQGVPFLTPLVKLKGGDDFYIVRGDTREVAFLGLNDWFQRLEPGCSVLLEPPHLFYHLLCILSQDPKTVPLMAILLCLLSGDMPKSTIPFRQACHAVGDQDLVTILTHPPPIHHLDRLPKRMALGGTTETWLLLDKAVGAINGDLPKDLRLCLTSIVSFGKGSKRVTIPKLREALLTFITTVERPWLFGSAGEKLYQLHGLTKTRHFSQDGSAYISPSFGQLTICLR